MGTQELGVGGLAVLKYPSTREGEGLKKGQNWVGFYYIFTARQIFFCVWGGIK